MNENKELSRNVTFWGPTFTLCFKALKVITECSSGVGTNSEFPTHWFAVPECSHYHDDCCSIVKRDLNYWDIVPPVRKQKVGTLSSLSPFNAAQDPSL